MRSHPDLKGVFNKKCPHAVRLLPSVDRYESEVLLGEVAVQFSSPLLMWRNRILRFHTLDFGHGLLRVFSFTGGVDKMQTRCVT